MRHRARPLPATGARRFCIWRLTEEGTERCVQGNTRGDGAVRPLKPSALRPHWGASAERRLPQRAEESGCAETVEARAKVVGARQVASFPGRTRFHQEQVDVGHAARPAHGASARESRCRGSSPIARKPRHPFPMAARRSGWLDQCRDTARQSDRTGLPRLPGGTLRAKPPGLSVRECQLHHFDDTPDGFQEREEYVRRVSRGCCRPGHAPGQAPIVRKVFRRGCAPRFHGRGLVKAEELSRPRHSP